MEEEREDDVEGWVFPTSIIIITIRFPAPWRKCNDTGADDDDDGVDVGGVDGGDGGIIYYYYCDYYSQANHRVTEAESESKPLER